MSKTSIYEALLEYARLCKDPSKLTEIANILYLLGPNTPVSEAMRALNWIYNKGGELNDQD